MFSFLDASMVIIEFYGYEEKVFEMQDKMSSKGGFLAWLGIMFLAGFTPLPFKVFTITSGVIAYNLPVFFLYAFTRGLDFSWYLILHLFLVKNSVTSLRKKVLSGLQ